MLAWLKKKTHRCSFDHLGTRMGKKKVEGFEYGTLTTYPMIWFYACECGRFRICCGGVQDIEITGVASKPFPTRNDLAKFVPAAVWRGDYD